MQAELDCPIKLWEGFPYQVGRAIERSKRAAAPDAPVLRGRHKKELKSTAAFLGGLNFCYWLKWTGRRNPFVHLYLKKQNCKTHWSLLVCAILFWIFLSFGPLGWGRLGCGRAVGGLIICSPCHPSHGLCLSELPPAHNCIVYIYFKMKKSKLCIFYILYIHVDICLVWSGEAGGWFSGVLIERMIFWGRPA